MSEPNYLSSLKDEEFSILRKLCDDSVSQIEKEKLEMDLVEVRSEIKKLQ